MAHSGYSVSDLIQYHALPYERIEGDYLLMDGEKVPIREDSKELVESNLLELPLYEYTPGAGGPRTTVPDLAQFMIAHMNQGLAPNGFQLLHPETVEMMHQSAGSEQGIMNSFNLVGQGMEWSLCQDGVDGHCGGQLGFGGTMVFKRTDEGTFGILVMRNVNLTYSEWDRKLDWNRNYYFKRASTSQASEDTGDAFTRARGHLGVLDPHRRVRIPLAAGCSGRRHGQDCLPPARSGSRFS